MRSPLNCVALLSLLIALAQGQACNHGDLRLRNGATTFEGRVEICFNGVWGTVTHDWWNWQDAKVVCRQLGIINNYNETALPFTNAYFGQGTGMPIHIDWTWCIGNETRLIDCAYRPPGAGDGHWKDAGVRCYTDEMLEGGACTHGDIRLSGTGATDRRGRVEVCFAGRWGTISHDNWDTVDARIMCKQLGFLNASAFAYDHAYFGQGTTIPVLLDVSVCIGWEDHFWQCSYKNPNGDTHAKDVGIRCITESEKYNSNCNFGDVRLRNGPNTMSGRLEICVDGVWGTVCDDGFNTGDAKVACRMLGFAAQGAQWRYSNVYGAGTGPIYMDNAACNGREDHLFDCNFDANTNDDNHNEDVGVVCLNPDCTEGDIRLIGGSDSNEGRVELCWEGFWGQPCDQHWGYYEAQVTCRKLGYNNTNVVFAYTGNDNFGNATLNIVARNWTCKGNEAELRKCGFFYGNGAGCNTVTRPAGVRCGPGNECTHGDVQLVNGSMNSNGRVEVCMNGIWGTVTDDRWGPQEATVVCRKLGFYGRYGYPVVNATYGQGTGPIVMDGMKCVGSEQTLQDCIFDPDASEDSHAEDAGVMCITAGGCTDGEVRLREGTTSSEGRVEICMGGVWGVIADLNWGTNEAKVICRQMGFTDGYGLPLTGSYFSDFNGPIHLKAVNCSGSEASLLSCGYREAMWDYTSKNAGVRCFNGTTSPVCNTGNIQLAGGSSMQGRVEVCVDGAWGTVCNNTWTTWDANVVCGQAGYATAGAQAVSTQMYGYGNRPVLIRSTNCKGGEAKLIDCDVDANVMSCSINQSAGVICSSKDCTDGNIMLSDGASDDEGRVEVCRRGKWGTVCDSLWGVNDAQVVCRQLGYTTNAVTAYRGWKFGPGQGWIWVTNTSCTGEESQLSQCWRSMDTTSCDHSRDAGVKCMPGSECTSGSVRLVGGTSNSEGRVQVCVNGIWGSVSTSNWGAAEAGVVCNQLGFISELSNPFSGSPYGQGSGHIIMTAVACTGNEQKLTDCAYSNNTETASHADDVGVRCFPQACRNGDVRLRGGAGQNEGRLEVCFGGQWGTVNDMGFSNENAQVVCRQLGYVSDGAMGYPNARYGEGYGAVLIHSMQCSGTENSILQCTLSGLVDGDNHMNDAGVMCAGRITTSSVPSSSSPATMPTRSTGPTIRVSEGVPTVAIAAPAAIGAVLLAIIIVLVVALIAVIVGKRRKGVPVDKLNLVATASFPQDSGLRSSTADMANQLYGDVDYDSEPAVSFEPPEKQ